MSNHYTETYFNWQRQYGEIGGWAEKPLFAPFIQPSDMVLDFGCGGGFLLHNLKCFGKAGIEINPVARKHAEEFGITVYASTQEVPDNFAEVIISNHALEHTINPFNELCVLRTKLKLGGRIVFCVPCETPLMRYLPNDINHHLYSWSPANLGNLFSEAGFKVRECKPIWFRWPPRPVWFARVINQQLFHLLCHIRGRLSFDFITIRVVADK